MKRSIFGAVVASTFLSFSAQAETVSISCGAVGQELELCQQGVAAWEKETGHTAKIVTTPNSTTERLALYQQLLAAGAKDIDVFQIDVIWPGILGNHFIDLTEYTNGAQDAHFPAIVANNTVRDRFVAMPWFTDAGVLYYRTDLLEKYGEAPPVTWEQLTTTAEKVMSGEREAGNDKMWGFVWQGRAYEGLTCDALEWVASYNGGTIVDEKGKITINNDRAKQALTTAAGWVDTISPPGVLNYGEEEARGVFQTGNAVFMRNWPYAWSLGNSEDSPVKGKIGVVALPKGGEDGSHAGTLGGWQLAVSKYSENPDVAASLVTYLTSFEEQKRRAIVGSYNPTIEALYQDEEVLTAVPFFGSLYTTFANGTPRPSSATGAKYNQVSNAFWNATHGVLSGRTDADAALTKLQKDLKRISRGGRW
ncbi:ABC transporter substrate-binding protein [Enterovibrio baiacu]|uniref:ABC transporter substrate-binding protein n=1 Tax=Enterovibrio baiacu TaxID=2491023 RepID=UPI003D09661B